jgi:hypothetical protein
LDLEAFCWLLSELLPNKLVGSALPILDVIRCFLRLGFGDASWAPASNRPMDNDGVPVTTVLSVGRLGPPKKP